LLLSHNCICPHHALPSFPTRRSSDLGHTDVAYVLMNGQIWFRVPETLLFKIEGNKPAHIMAKDIILQIIGDIGTDGANYKAMQLDRKSTRLNSSHVSISYAVFCLKKK